MQFKHIFVIGAGGIGSHLMEPLARLLSYHKNGTKKITLIDGDFYEEKNQIRQLFDSSFIGSNKAEALSNRISNSLKDISIESIPKYIDEESFTNLVSFRVSVNDPILVITAVDNHATRKAVIEALDNSNYQNFVFISGGNGYDKGQVLVYVKIRGEPGTVHPFDKYDDLKYPTDHIPGKPGCQDEATSTPQLITANASAAVGILWTVQAMLDDSPWFEEIHFDSKRMKMVSQGDSIVFPEIDNISKTMEIQSVIV